jgi:hydroxypyruvate reductase
MSGKHNAISIFQAAIAAVHPSNLISKYIQLADGVVTIGQQSLPISTDQKIFVIGAGKATAAMALETEKILGDHIYKGCITTKYQHAIPLKKIDCWEAAHPIPDQNSFLAVEKTIQLLQEATANDIIICLLSGGSSSLWADVPEELSLADMQIVFDRLLKSGATIHENNTVRKHLSKIKGGQLLRYAPNSKWFTLILSDVPDNDLSVVASGPTVADNSTYEDALGVLKKYQLETMIPTRVWEYLQRGAKSLFAETVKHHDPLLHIVTNIMIGTNDIAIKAASEKAQTMGYQVHRFHPLHGDAIITARTIIEFCKSYTGSLPACVLTGGETTLQVTGTGMGGRNQHMALTALIEMKKRKDNETYSLTFLAAGTDGTDGPTDAAGAIADIESIAMCVQKKLDPDAYFTNCDAYSFFKQTGGLLKTGPTQTNVMDLVLVLIE